MTFHIDFVNFLKTLSGLKLSFQYRVGEEDSTQTDEPVIS